MLQLSVYQVDTLLLLLWYKLPASLQVPYNIGSKHEMGKGNALAFLKALVEIRTMGCCKKLILV